MLGAQVYFHLLPAPLSSQKLWSRTNHLLTKALIISGLACTSSCLKHFAALTLPREMAARPGQQGVRFCNVGQGE